MTGDPTKVSHATEAILRVHVEAVLHSHSGTKKEASNGVHNALRLSSRAGGLRKEV